MALAALLVTGAGLLIRSFWRLQDIDPGFKPENVLTARIELPTTKYRDADWPKVVDFYAELVRRLDALPGAASVGAAFSHSLDSGFTMDELLAESVGEPRFRTLLLTLFAAVGLLLAAVGIYGVMAYSVSQRTREIGLRMAMGAGRGSVLRQVLGEGLRLTIAGLAIGLAGALALTRSLSSLLFGISPTDPATFAVVAVVLTGVALAGSYVPARRAALVDPMEALRYE